MAHTTVRHCPSLVLFGVIFVAVILAFKVNLINQTNDTNGHD